MTLTLDQYLFLLTSDITRSLLNGLSLEKQGMLWAEIGRQEDRINNYVKDFDYNHVVLLLPAVCHGVCGVEEFVSTR